MYQTKLCGPHTHISCKSILY